MPAYHKALMRPVQLGFGPLFAEVPRDRRALFQVLRLGFRMLLIQSKVPFAPESSACASACPCMQASVCYHRLASSSALRVAPAFIIPSADTLTAS